MNPVQVTDATNQLLLTMKDVGIAIVLSVIIGLALIALIILVRSRSQADTNTTAQTERLLELFGKALNNQDTETARAIRQQTEVIALNRISLDQNTLAFQENRQYREETLSEMKNLTTLQSQNNNLVAALRIDVSAWPKEVMSSVGNLEKNLEKALKELKVEIVQSILELPPNSGLARYFQDILTKLDQILSSVSSNAALIQALSAPPPAPVTQRPPPTLPPAPSNDALMLKRGTGEITPVKLEPDAYKPSPKPDDPKDKAS